MGKVFKAKQIDADREVALKFLKAEVHDEESRARFFREFKILSELRHQNIMTVYGLALDPQAKPYAICELLEGKSLRGLLEQGALPWRKAVNIALQVCEALGYAHNNGVIHRDLKPENIVLVDKPQPDTVKLIDFGLSKIMGADAQKLTATGHMLGSPLYMSPELSEQQADQRSDIYALACIIFEMLAGEHLFPADNSVAAIYRHSVDRATQRISAIKNEVPESLVQLTLEMLAKDPQSRTQSTNEVAERLRSILDSPGKSLGRDFLKPGKNKSVPMVLAGIAILIIASIVLHSVTLKPKEASAITYSKPAITYSNTAKKGPAELKLSFSKQLAALDKERWKIHDQSVDDTALHGSNAGEKYRKPIKDILEKFKALEPSARTRQNKFALYWFEGLCFGELNDRRSNLLCLQKCLSLCQADKTEKFAETPGLLDGMAAAYGTFLNEPEKAIPYAKQAIELENEYDQWIASGHELKVLYDEFPARRVRSSYDILANECMRKRDFAKAAYYAKLLTNSEVAALPVKHQGNGTIPHVLMYAEALIMMGKSAEATRYVEEVLSHINKIGEIPKSTQHPLQQKAVACDVLRIYQSAIYWFKNHGMPKLAEKYAQKSKQFADFYQLDYDPYSKKEPIDPNAKDSTIR
jgi:serine/threonine protein kinase